MDLEANMSLLEDIKIIINRNIDLKKDLSDEEIEEISKAVEKSWKPISALPDKQLLIIISLMQCAD